MQWHEHKINIICGNKGVQRADRTLLVNFLVLEHLFSIILEAEEEMKSCHCLIKTWLIVCYGDMMMPSKRNLLLKSYFRDAKIQ